jgi:GNAT superfamily N-acetyltransferase
MLVIKIIEKNSINLVSEHYKNTGYSQEINLKDIIIVALESEQIIAAVRLCPQEKYLVLRGMRVSKEYQRKGIGTALLNKCAEIIDKKTCYCLPYKHLINFYQQAKFYEILPQEAPKVLEERLNNYLNMGLNVTIMKKFDFDYEAHQN